MRIALLANPASPHTRRWATALAERGNEVHVLGIRPATIPGVTVHVVRIPMWPGVLASFASYARLLASVRRRCRAIGPDVVNAHYTVTHGAISVLARLRPVVVTVWGTDLVRGDHVVPGPKRWLNRWVLTRADTVTTASRFLARAAGDVAGASVRIEVVPFGVDTAAFPSGPPVAAPRIGFVKHLHSRYGPDIAIEAFARVAVSRPDAELVIAGSGPRRGRLEQAVRARGLAERVRFVGPISHRAVPRLLQSLAVLVSPSRSESFGVVLLEASSCGIPVVATRVGGTPETVVDGTTGVLVPPGDVDGLARTLGELLDDEPRRLEMGRNGRTHVQAKYEWSRCVDAMVEVLQSVSTGG